jgi:hypothetical protein
MKMIGSQFSKVPRKLQWNIQRRTKIVLWILILTKEQSRTTKKEPDEFHKSNVLAKIQKSKLKFTISIFNL